MDDLDALLADLQSTTSHINTYQQVAPQVQSSGPNSRDSTPPPPLPPPPSQDTLDALQECDNGQAIYQPTTVRHYQSAMTVTTNTTSTGPMASQTSPPPPLKPAVPKKPMPPQVAPKPGSTSSALRNNLSELDILLQDLSSAQFIAEVDRRNAENVSIPQTQQTTFKEQTIITPKTGRERSVDSLLEDLDSMVPQPQSGEPGLQLQKQSSAASQQQQLQQQQAAASTATRELDDLMSMLSDFKVQGNKPQHVGEPPYAKPNKTRSTGSTSSPPVSAQIPSPTAQPFPVFQDNTAAQVYEGGPATMQGSTAVHSSHQAQMSHPGQQMSHPGQQMSHQGQQMSHPGQQMSHGTQITTSSQQGMVQQQHGNLDAMLGDLHTDMTRQGVTTVPKGHCAACRKAIVGQVITALGQIWHPEHFACAQCNCELGTQNFFEREGRPYCERDYHTLFSPKCAYCAGPILDKCVTALDKTWHPEHFFCAQCGHQFGDDGFHERDGKAFCRDDYFELFAPKCGGCGGPIMDNYISALSRQWHPECFVCRECHMPFGGGSFFDHEGMPYCETHYHAKRGSLCAGCQKPITGRCITAMYKKFHPEHFICAFCLRQLNKGTFKEQNEKPYCHPCFVKLFG